MQDKIRELEKAKELALEERDREWEKKLSQKVSLSVLLAGVGSGALLSSNPKGVLRIKSL